MKNIKEFKNSEKLEDIYVHQKDVIQKKNISEWLNDGSESEGHGCRKRNAEHEATDQFCAKFALLQRNAWCRVRKLCENIRKF